MDEPFALFLKVLGELIKKDNPKSGFDIYNLCVGEAMIFDSPEDYAVYDKGKNKFKIKKSHWDRAEITLPERFRIELTECKNFTYQIIEALKNLPKNNLGIYVAFVVGRVIGKPLPIDAPPQGVMDAGILVRFIQ